MKHALLTTAAAALLLASQGAFAQPQNRGDGPGAGPQAPGPGASPGAGPGIGPGNAGQAPGRSGPSGDSPGPRANPGRGGADRAPAQQGPGPGPRAEQPQRQPQKQAQPPAQQKPQQKTEQKSDQKSERQRTGEGKQQTPPRADAKGKDAEQNRTARDGASPKADGKADTKDSARKDADRTKDRDRNDTAQGKAEPKDKGDRTAGNQDLRQARERLDRQERERLHNAFDRRRAKANVRVDVNIGGRVPRNVRLVRVPQTVITFFPYYRDYSYFVVEEQVYIVNPRTYEVVDVIDEGYGRGQPVQQARLNLSDSQIVMVREAVADADIQPESLRLRLALGAEIPRDVELHRFPARVLDNVRDLETYRFVLVDDQIVIVKPDDRSIALVIDRM